VPVDIAKATENTSLLVAKAVIEFSEINDW